MKRKLTAGITSVALPLFIADTSSTTGGGLVGLAYNTANLVAEYRRQGQSTWTAITLVSGTLGTYVSGGLVTDGSLTGAYEFCPPDACFTTGARWVAIRLRGAANMLPVLIEVELDTLDYQATGGKVPATLASGDVTGNLPANVLQVNGTAQTAGDLAALLATLTTYVDAEVAAILSQTTAILAAVDTEVGARINAANAHKAKTDNLPNAPAAAGDAMNLVDEAITAATLAADALTAIQAAAAAALAAYDPPTGTEATADKEAILAAVAGVAARTALIPDNPAAVGSAMTLTSGERNAGAAALLDLADGIEAGLTPRQALRLLAAVLGGLLSGAGTGTEVFRAAVANHKARVTATVDEAGNRSVVAVDLA